MSATITWTRCRITTTCSSAAFTIVTARGPEALAAHFGVSIYPSMEALLADQEVVIVGKSDRSRQPLRSQQGLPARGQACLFGETDGVIEQLGAGCARGVPQAAPIRGALQRLERDRPDAMEGGS